MQKFAYKIHRGLIGMVEDGQNRIYKVGEIVQLTEEQAAKRKDARGPMVERVDLDALQAISDAKADLTAAKAAEEAGDGEAATSYVAAMNVSEAVDFIDAVEDEAVLDAVEAEERAGKKPRKGVLDAVARIRAEFNGDDDDEEED